MGTGASPRSDAMKHDAKIPFHINQLSSCALGAGPQDEKAHRPISSSMKQGTLYISLRLFRPEVLAFARMTA